MSSHSPLVVHVHNILQLIGNNQPMTGKGREPRGDEGIVGNVVALATRVYEIVGLSF